SLCISSKSLRKSWNFRAFVYFSAALPRLLSSTSHRATRFSLATLPVFDFPRPPAPMMARLSFSLGERLCARLTPPSAQKPAPAQAVDRRNSRRLLRPLMENSLLG